MNQIQPSSAAELSRELRQAAAGSTPIRLGGAFTKDSMGGSVRDPGVSISTSALRRVIAYEPKDLTVSVEAGLPYSELTALLAAQGQMLPLDPPLASASTVGGVIASNLSGSRRRLYGAARDMVIGMSYCTLDGAIAESGALVVRSVAGYDIHKLLIGSFGTLVAIVSVNFKVVPAPELTRTFVLSHATLAAALESRAILASGALQPVAVDYLNPAAAALCGLENHVVLVRAAGSERLLARYARELPAAETIGGERESALWAQVNNLAPDWLSVKGGLAVVKLVHPAQDLLKLAGAVPGPVWSHLFNGVTRLACRDSAELALALSSGPVALVEWSYPARRQSLELWPSPGPDFQVMKDVKAVFDPNGLLNPGRLHGRI